MELFINENAAKIVATIFAQIWNDLYFQIAKIFAKRNMDIFSVVITEIIFLLDLSNHGIFEFLNKCAFQ